MMGSGFFKGSRGRPDRTSNKNNWPTPAHRCRRVRHPHPGVTGPPTQPNQQLPAKTPQKG
jgi:hypothetical protein